MSLASRYLFDNSFDVPRGPLPSAPSAAELEAEQAIRRQQEATRMLEAARAEGYAVGHAAGLRDGQAAAEEGHTRDMLSMMEHVVESMTILGQQEAANRQRADAAALGCAAAILGRMVPALVAREGLREIEGLLADCLVQAQDEPRLVLRTPTALFSAMKEQLDRIAAEAAFSGKIVLIADATLGPQGARLEWADGGVERDPQKLWAEIEAAIARILGTPSQAAAAAHRTEASRPPAQASPSTSLGGAGMAAQPFTIPSADGPHDSLAQTPGAPSV